MIIDTNLSIPIQNPPSHSFLRTICINLILSVYRSGLSRSRNQFIMHAIQPTMAASNIRRGQLDTGIIVFTSNAFKMIIAALAAYLTTYFQKYQGFTFTILAMYGILKPKSFAANKMVLVPATAYNPQFVYRKRGIIMATFRRPQVRVAIAGHLNLFTAAKMLSNAFTG